MKKYKVYPCNYVDGMDLQNEEITSRRLDVLFHHLEQEVEEAREELHEFTVTGSGKHLASFAFEVVDIMTCGATLLCAMSRMVCAPSDFDKHSLKSVKHKNITRGYVRNGSL